MDSIFQDDYCCQSNLGHNNPLPSPLYNEDNLMDDSQGSLLEIMKSEFPYTGPSFWDAEPELSSDNVHFTPAEDFQKILNDWQEHLGAMQASDSDDIDVCAGQPFPDSIFDSDVSLSSAPPSASNSRSLLKPRQERMASASSSVYGMKAESQDARLPIMADSEDENEVLKPLKECKMELDDEDCVDVETVAEQMPVLEAGDLKSLLEQFEASESVNNPADIPTVVPPQSLPTLSNNLLVLSNQKIREALPQEVVEKIKATSRKKVIPVIPAIPSKRLVTGTRMQDAAATLSRNKLLKIVAAGDTVQLDHDYCSSIGESPQVNFYNCNSNEYKNSPVPSRTSAETAEENKELKPAVNWEKNSKKDSGLESGEVSDASEEAAPPAKAIAEAPPIKKKLNLQEYRSRREELDRMKANSSKSSSSAASSCLSSPAHPASPGQATLKPEMHSVEVQTQEHDNMSMQQLDKTDIKDYKLERPSRSTHRNRHYRSHNSEFHGRSSSGSSSSSSSFRRSGQRSRRKQRRVTSSSSSSGSSTSRSRSTGASSTKRRRRDSSSHRRRSRQRSRYSSRSRNRSNSPASTSSSVGSNVSLEWYPNGKDRQRQVEERRVIYVGRLPDGTTKVELRRRFERFGPIIDISIHFREHGDNYGFVTFAFKVDAYEAVEHGNEDPTLPKYDLCFGGRRTFCKVRYSDLDAQNSRGKNSNIHHGDSFDNLLRETQAKLQKRGKKL